MEKYSPVTDFAENTVLIADDDQIIRDLLRSMLRTAGLQVLAETSTGERTLAAYKLHRPEIVCLDINMPGMSGLEVLREIRALSAETIVVLITGETTQDNVLKAIEGKADGVIVKPFNRARVMAEIARGLRRRESGKQPEPPASMK
jgi:two-component system, chemotaxis family, chemotaxis protein CheY